MEMNGGKWVQRNYMQIEKHCRYNEETKDKVLWTPDSERFLKRIFDHFDENRKTQVCRFTEVKGSYRNEGCKRRYLL